MLATDGPAGLADAARKELAKNIKALAEQTKLSFTVYSSAGVRDLLNDVFHRKCAYCESSIAGTQPLAIEHYRPKGKITISATEERVPGYYWLAGDWKNLLPSCTDCNSPRNQPSGSGPPVLMGKGNLFPIANESRRATEPGQEERERRLLLHPYFDNPDEHLEFIDEGIVRPRKRTSKANRQITSRMGIESINVYALQRPGLVQERDKEQTLLLKQIERVKREARRWQSDPTDADQERILREEIAELKKFASDDHRYAGMSRQVIRSRANELGNVD